MDNTKTDETTHSDTSEPIVSWSGVQGETQEENVEIPNSDELETEATTPPAAGEKNS